MMGQLRHAERMAAVSVLGMLGRYRVMRQRTAAVSAEDHVRSLSQWETSRQLSHRSQARYIDRPLFQYNVSHYIRCSYSSAKTMTQPDLMKQRPHAEAERREHGVMMKGTAAR